MKRTISTLALAAPLATAALSLGATPAMAEPAGPASDQITSNKLGPVNPHVPEDPKETLPIDPDPEPGPDLPDMPDEKADLPECPTHGDCGDDPDDEKDPEDGDDDGDDFEKPNRIDAGAGETDAGLQLAWLMAGGGLITATGAAYAVRRRSSMGA